MILAGVLAVLASQPAPARGAEELIERLRSESVEERDDAARALRALGKAAAPALRKAAGDPDPEIRGRVRRLLDLIALGGAVPAALEAAFPGEGR